MGENTVSRRQVVGGMAMAGGLALAAAAPGAGAAAVAAAAGPAMAWSSGHARILGRQVFYRTHGGGSGIPLLLVHGGQRGRGTSSQPYELLSALGRERRLVSWDQLGCGRSDPPPDAQNWGIARCAEEMQAVRNALASGPVHVFAGSYGTAITLEWLARSRPVDIASLTLMCPIIDGARAMASMQAAQAAAGTQFQSRFITRHSVPGAGEGPPPDPALLRTMGEELGRWNRLETFSALEVPVLLIRGEHDYISAQDMQAYAATNPAARTATIADAAHLAFIDQPERTCTLLRDFLATTSS